MTKVHFITLRSHGFNPGWWFNIYWFSWYSNVIFFVCRLYFFFPQKTANKCCHLVSHYSSPYFRSALMKFIFLEPQILCISMCGRLRHGSHSWCKDWCSLLSDWKAELGDFVYGLIFQVWQREWSHWSAEHSDVCNNIDIFVNWSDFFISISISISS